MTGATIRAPRAPGPPLLLTRSQADDRAWVAALGGQWRAVLAGLVVLACVVGAAAPVADPDVTIHLATGEWIRRHGTVPLVEPFAWTRAGEPFYAYSWAAELLYAHLWHLGGLAALQALRGLECGLAVLAVGWLGRVLGWRPWTTLYVAAVHLDLALRVAPFVRPQFVHFIALPLVWGLAYRLWGVETARSAEPGAGRRRAWTAVGLPLAALGLLGAVVANTHLLFPLTAVPVGLVALAAPRADLRRGAAALGALALGWLAGPNALHWPAIFAQNFAPNALITYPSPIAEYQPGFHRLLDANGTAALALLLLLPWALPVRGPGAPSGRERLWFGVAWAVGLLGFGVVGKTALVWWLALLPMVARVVDRLPSPTTGGRVLRLLPLLAWGGVLGFRFHALAEARRPVTAAAPRAAPTVAGAALEPLLAVLEREIGLNGRGRVLTQMEFGGYLTWRAPGLSPSIDGRTIYPDSIAGAETFVAPLVAARPLGPIAGADLALLPLAAPTAAVLDTAAGWQRLAVSRPAASGAAAGVPAAGLWVRRDWWASARAARAARPRPTIDTPE